MEAEATVVYCVIVCVMIYCRFDYHVDNGTCSKNVADDGLEVLDCLEVVICRQGGKGLASGEFLDVGG